MAGSRDIKTQSGEITPEEKEICEECADDILGWTRNPPHIGIYSACHRIFSCFNDPKACKQLTRQYIADSKNPEDLRNAALIHFDYVDRLYSSKTEPLAKALPSKEYCESLLTAMRSPGLTLEYANNLYKSCHRDTECTLEPEKNRYKLSIWLIPKLKSEIWQKTVEKIRTIALQKLTERLAKLDVPASIALLENARTLPIFNEHTSSSIVTGAIGRTRPVQWIDMELNKLKQTQPEYQMRKFGF